LENSVVGIGEDETVRVLANPAPFYQPVEVMESVWTDEGYAGSLASLVVFRLEGYVNIVLPCFQVLPDMPVPYHEKIISPESRILRRQTVQFLQVVVQVAENLLNLLPLVALVEALPAQPPSRAGKMVVAVLLQEAPHSGHSVRARIDRHGLTPRVNQILNLHTVMNLGPF